MKILKITGIILLIALAIAVAWYYLYTKKEKPIVLNTEKPAYGYIARSVTATGSIEPEDTVSVGTQVSGTIKYVYADFNSIVKKGELIAELDKSLLQAQVDQYVANLAVAKSQLVYEKSTYDMQNKLYSTGAISKTAYQDAVYQYNSAVANVQSVQAQLDAAQKNLSYADIYSPVDGVVMMRNISVGQTVAASFSTPTLFVIAKDISKMVVQASVDEADIGNVKIGQRTSFTVDAYPDNTFAGTVEEIRLEPAVSANVVTYTTIINAPNEQLKLKPGMTANITIYTKEDSNALLISARALKFKPDESFSKQYKLQALSVDSSSQNKVRHKTRPAGDSSRKAMDTTGAVIPKKAYMWVIEGDSLIQKKIIIGLNDDTNVEVLHGLSTDDEVVDGVENVIAAPTSSGATQSPFMPARPGSGTKKQ